MDTALFGDNVCRCGGFRLRGEEDGDFKEVCL